MVECTRDIQNRLDYDSWQPREVTVKPMDATDGPAVPAAPSRPMLRLQCLAPMVSSAEFIKRTLYIQYESPKASYIVSYNHYLLRRMFERADCPAHHSIASPYSR